SNVRRLTGTNCSKTCPTTRALSPLPQLQVSGASLSPHRPLPPARSAVKSPPLTLEFIAAACGAQVGSLPAAGPVPKLSIADSDALLRLLDADADVTVVGLDAVALSRLAALLRRGIGRAMAAISTSGGGGGESGHFTDRLAAALVGPRVAARRKALSIRGWYRRGRLEVIKLSKATRFALVRLGVIPIP
ncbi:hypothetical protein HK405_013262, partial [Cladochytrium tenue]